MVETLVHIDGAKGEGGGQVLRSALTCSLLTGRPFELVNIRAKREKGGLRAQHLECVRAAAAVGGAFPHGAALHSRTLRFEPAELVGGEHAFFVNTAGSTSLILQTILLPLAFAGVQSTVRLGGGTHQRYAPSFHFIERTFLPAVARLGLSARATLERPGFFPQGGGRVRLSVQPLDQPLRALDLAERGDVVECRVLACFSGLPEHVADRATQAARKELQTVGKKVIGKPRTVVVDSFERPANPGGALQAGIRFQNGFADYQGLAERGVKAEHLGAAAGKALREFVQAKSKTDGAKATVDEHLADQLLLPCALAAGESRFRTLEVTDHLLTNADVLRQFLDCEIEIHGTRGERCVEVVVHGAGVQPISA